MVEDYDHNEAFEEDYVHKKPLKSISMLAYGKIPQKHHINGSPIGLAAVLDDSLSELPYHRYFVFFCCCFVKFTLTKMIATIIFFSTFLVIFMISYYCTNKLILILYPATYPYILPSIHSFIISLVTTFVVKYLFYPMNNQL